MKVEAYKCDSCGKIIPEKTQVYVLNLKSIGKWWEVDSWEYNEIELHFCWNCAVRLIKSLEKIAAQMSKEEADT